ncbi:glycosyltransferase family 2 protein [Natronomonas gomsonensis]|uniref:glycosyltransferase n=1 Tax=Natronomonas gomsonensis TaxID=1046043 RepID=UPI0015B823BC|nr:glycosyltransferase family A protein [Natronomonas gomsonensis]
MDVLVTHYEQNETVSVAIESLRRQLSAEDGIYVVDAGSEDDSFSELERFDAQRDIELVYRDGVSRGRGRQIAFEHADSDVVVAQADLDTEFHAALPDLVEYYRRLTDDRGPGILLVNGCLIGYRDVIEDAGGWRDLQVHEDKDLWMRVDERATLYVLPVTTIKHHANFEWSSLRYRLRRRYRNYRDALRLGVPADVLAASLRHHRPIHRRGTDALLFALARRRAAALEQYSTLDGVDFDPEASFLRELTFEALVDSGAIDPVFTSPPETLRQYESESAYPGQTSYSESS